MKRHARIFSFLALALAGLSGCSSTSSDKASTKADTAIQKIQGKAQVLIEDGGAGDTALNAGGSSVYIWEGTHRYRLFMRRPFEVVHGSVYTVEGIHAQKVIEDLGDPDEGKNGYPLPASCQRVVTMAWKDLPFDGIDAQAQVLRARVKRYPARSVFLVTKISLAPEGAAGEAAKKAAADQDVKEVEVAWDKQRALLTAGALTKTAPLWEPAGGTAKCNVLIDQDGTISELRTGAQLCETVLWSEFRFQPPVLKGKPVKVSTDVEVRFEPRKKPATSM